MTIAGTVMVQDGSVTEPGQETLPSLELLGPIAGFPEHRDFVLVELDQSGLLCSLQSMQDQALRFLVLPPGPFFPDYAPEISDDWADQLEITDAAEALVLLIITPGATATEATANLLAPIVINLRTRRGAQVVLEDLALPLRAPLRPAE